MEAAFMFSFMLLLLQPALAPTGCKTKVKCNERERETTYDKRLKTIMDFYNKICLWSGTFSKMRGYIGSSVGLNGIRCASLTSLLRRRLIRTAMSQASGFVPVLNS